MAKEWFFSNITPLERALDVVWKRHEVISHNISNADTPGYKKKKAVFEEELASALAGHGLEGRQTREKHLRIGDPPINEIEAKIIEVDSTKKMCIRDSIKGTAYNRPILFLILFIAVSASHLFFKVTFFIKPVSKLTK